MEKMDFNAAGLKQKASGEKRSNKKLFSELKKLPSSLVDKKIHSFHELYTEKIDCLQCANCCKSISPAINNRDIDRIARYLRVKPSEITEQYLLLDEEGDYVFKSQPCPFLGADNYCAVYDARPKACREYPHTDRGKQQQIFDITFKNISVCPIVYEIVQELKKDNS